jgi:hypothetical protein
MSYTDAISRISQIQDQIASVRSAFTPTAAQSATAGTTATTATTPATAGGTAASATVPTSFADTLSGAMGSTPTTSSLALTPGLPTTAAASGLTATGLTTPGLTTTAASGGAGLPAGASSTLTSDQQQFASRLSADTGLDPGVVSAWVLAEESGGAAGARQSAGNNDWLNIGYTGSGTFGSGDAVWSDPLSAADATAGWLKGQNTIPGYGTASSGVQGILGTAGMAPADQIAALQRSGWAASGYPQLASLYQQVAG